MQSVSHHEASSWLGLRHGPTCFAWGICSQEDYGVPMSTAPSATRSWNSSQGAAPQDHSRSAQKSFMEGSWFSLTLVPNPRELGPWAGSRASLSLSPSPRLG